MDFEDKNFWDLNKPRSKRIFWLQKGKGEKDLLVVDNGYQFGTASLFVYEFKESVEIRNIKNEFGDMRKFLKSLSGGREITFWYEMK